MFENLVSQENAKQHFELFIKSAKQFGDRMPDIILSGPSGIGKSSFARALAVETDYTYSIYNPIDKVSTERTAFFEINSQAIKSMEELFAYLQGDYQFDIPYNDNVFSIPHCIIFFDEAHKLHQRLRTQLLSAMDERRSIDFKYGKNMISKLDFSKVTFVCATTDINDLERALINRFKTIELQPYSVSDIAQMIVSKKPDHWSPNIAYSVGVEIGKRAKTVMRTAVLDLETIDKYFRVNDIYPSAESTITFYNQFKQVDEDGLDHVDMSILETLIEGNLGVKSIGGRLAKSEREVSERLAWLANIGAVIKAGGGQEITNKGRLKLGLDPVIENLNQATTTKQIPKDIKVNKKEAEGLSWITGMKRPSKALNTKASERTPEQVSQVKAWYHWKKTESEQINKQLRPEKV